MATLAQTCSECSTRFEPRFSYQMEERRTTGAQPRTYFAFYCSQECLTRSHRQPTAPTVCDCCRAGFQVELAAHVVFVGGRRRYACSASCREQIIEESQGVKLGSLKLSQASVSAATDVPSPAREATPIQPDNDARSGRVLAVFNHKGGTGKTTTSVTVAAGLAETGARVLLVDTDAQGNVGVSLGLESDRSLYHVLVMGLQPESVWKEVRPNLCVLPANETLAAAELYLAGRKSRHAVLSDRLQSARAQFDYIVVDCSPSLSLMNQNALAFSDAVLCPVACDYLSLVGVRQVLRTLKNVNRLLGHPVKLWGVLPTLFDSRAKICHEAYDTLRDHFKERCLSPIHSAIRVKEAPAYKQTLFEFAPDSRAARDYRQVVAQLLQSAAQTAANQDHDPPVRWGQSA